MKLLGVLVLCILFFFFSSVRVFAGNTILWGNLYSPYLTDQVLDNLAAGHVTGFNIIANVQGDTPGTAVDSFGNGGISRMSPTSYQNYLNLVKQINADAKQRGMSYIFTTLWAAGGNGNTQEAITAMASQAKFTKDAGITGVLIDAEPYFGSPWIGDCPSFFNAGRLGMQAMLAQNPLVIVILAPHFSLGFGYDCYYNFYQGMASAGGTIVVAPEPWYNPAQGDINTLAGQLYPLLQGNSSVGWDYWKEANPEQTIRSNNTNAPLFALIYSENLNDWLQQNGTAFLAAQKVLPPLTPVSPTPIPLVVDLNGDGKINILDYQLLVGNFGRAGIGDINNDGKVNIFDFNIFVKNYGK